MWWGSPDAAMSSSVLLLVESYLQFPTLRPLCITKALYMSLYVTIINHGREWELVVLFAVNREWHHKPSGGKEPYWVSCLMGCYVQKYAGLIVMMICHHFCRYFFYNIIKLIWLLHGHVEESNTLVDPTSHPCCPLSSFSWSENLWKYKNSSQRRMLPNSLSQ